MKILVSGATKTLKKLSNNDSVGCLLTPRSGNSLQSMDGFLWAADNSAFSNFDEKKFIRMLEKIKGTNCIFVTCPDVVGDGVKTMNLFNKWEPIIKSYGLPVSLVAQNGMNIDNIPFEKISCLFIGGDDKFKLGKEVIDIVKKAKQKNIWVHMGRVNSHKRIRYAYEIGCDSVDGSGYSRFAEKKLLPAIKFLEKLKEEKQIEIVFDFD